MSVSQCPAPEGIVSLVSVEGAARECGRAYGEIVLDKYPGYTRYLNEAVAWRSASKPVLKLFEARAPHIPEIYRGLRDVLGERQGGMEKPRPAPEACTSFSVAPDLTLDKAPISGQTKDTELDRLFKYIVLRMRIKGAPTILVLAYPGELLGYGMWSTGMTIFRNNLYAAPNATAALTMVEWGLLALAGPSVNDGRELASEHGVQDSGNCLLSDASGDSLSVEFNAGGVSFIPPRRGINTHANHPVGEETAPHEDYPDPKERDDSRHRMDDLWASLDAQRGRLTARKALMCLADHSRYPRGVCRHRVEDKDYQTTAAVVAEPTKGLLRVIRGNPRANRPATYAFED